MITQEQKAIFQAAIWSFYQQQGRTFAWRHNTNPYHVLVSEIMLQQTQTQRVVEKFEQFITTFADFATLASAPRADLLSVWQGLGYNRRALYLQQAAMRVVEEHNACLPADHDALRALPGIGPYTAAAVCAFAFNQPTVFIETNIRAVFIDAFFPQQEKVADKDLMPLIAATVDIENPRDWYYALMDYGVHIKSTRKNPTRKSKHYTKQSKFEGSDRQIRGAIIRYLVAHNNQTLDALHAAIPCAPERFERIINGLQAERLITLVDGVIHL